MMKQAKEAGKTIYEHLRFNFLSHKPEEYVNPEIRKEVMMYVEKMSTSMVGLSTEEKITKLRNDKKISIKEEFYIRKLFNTCEKFDGLTNFKEVESLLNNFNNDLINDKEMNIDEKSLILNTSEMIKSSLDYYINVAIQLPENNLSSRSSCIFGKKLTCIGSALASTILVVVDIVVPNPKTLKIVASVIKAGVDISKIFTDKSCDCGSTPCYNLYGISVFRDQNMDCAGNLISFCIYGEGPSPNTYTWGLHELDQYNQIIAGSGQPINTSGPCIQLSPNSNLNKKFRLTITTSGTPNCNNGASVTKEYDFTWGEIVGNPGTVIIDGQSDVYVSNTSTYFLNGTCLTNPKNTFTWIFNLFQGSFTFGNIVSGGGSNSSVTINWTGASCGPGAFGQPNSSFNGCWYLGIGGKSTNSCSGSQQWGSKQVAVRKY
jgi:Fe-S cluster assembly iron-binding protein IscA